MPEATNDRAHNPEARRDADHGITITVSPHEDGVPFTWPWRAQCLCGWQSATVRSRPDAAAAGNQHIAEGSVAIRDTPGCTDVVRHPLCDKGGSEPFDEVRVEGDEKFGARVHEGPVVYDNGASVDDNYFVLIAQREMRSAATGVTHFEPASVVVYTPDDRIYLPVTQARDVAAGIVAAADLTDAAIESAPGSAKAKPLAVWQTKPCPAWCVVEHSDDDHPDDRDHGGEIRSVGLRSYPAVDWGSDKWQLPRWGTYLRAPAAGETVVYTFSDEIASGSLLAVEMHLDEAKQLVSTLLATIAEAGDPAEVTR